MAAPTLVSTTVSNSPAAPDVRDSSGTRTTPSISVQAGDLLVAKVFVENGTHVGASYTLSDTGGNTWTRQETQGQGSGSFAFVAIYTATAAATTSITVTFNRNSTATSSCTGVAVTVYRTHGGVGVHSSTTNAGTAPTMTLTTSGANSAVTMEVCDFNALDGASRAYRTGSGAYPYTEPTGGYWFNSIAYTNYNGTYLDMGAAGSKTIGLTAPTGQVPAMAYIEIKASAGGGSTVKQLAALGVG